MAAHKYIAARRYIELFTYNDFPDFQEEEGSSDDEALSKEQKAEEGQYPSPFWNRFYIQSGAHAAGWHARAAGCLRVACRVLPCVTAYAIGSASCLARHMRLSRHLRRELAPAEAVAIMVYAVVFVAIVIVPA